VVSLKQFIERQYGARQPSRPRASRRPMREDVGDVQVMRSFGFDAASIALPADIDLEVRADRMNSFWRALVEFQYQDVLVVALAVGDES
jgi:hypothetical protein